MCGRYSVTSDLDELVEVFGAPPLDGVDLGLPRYNVAPTQDAPVVAVGKEGRRLAAFRWGLVPFWADDASIGNRMINARAETVAEKPAFREAFGRRRCLVAADGFYEWRKPEEKGGTKRPYWIHRPDRRPFAFAGLWERWGDREDPLLTFTILTTRADEWMRPIHDRMPVLLPPGSWDAWLDRDTDPDSLGDLLGSPPEDALEAWEVAPVVNRPANDVPECIEPLA